MRHFQTKALVQLDLKVYTEQQARTKLASLPLAFEQQGMTVTFLTDPELKEITDAGN